MTKGRNLLIPETLKMAKSLKNLDPTADFIKSIRKSAHKRGKEIAIAHFEGDMADVMGEVLGDMMFGAVVSGIGNSLYDVPMNP